MNGRQAKSPCLELGSMINQTGSSREKPNGCVAGSEGPKNMPPGFTWRVDLTDTYDQNREMTAEDNIVVPNMAVDGSTLFVWEKFYQGVVKADVSVYIQADLDAEQIRISPGVIRVNASYCGAALNTQATGSLDVLILNTSPTSAGSYLVTASCFSNVANQQLTLTPSTQQGPFSLNAGETLQVEFGVEATGPLVLGDAKCEVVLTAGGGAVSGPEVPEAGFTSRVIVTCDIFLPSLIGYAYQDFLAEPRPGEHGCTGSGFFEFMCENANAPWYIRYATYIVLAVIVIVTFVIVIGLVVYAASNATALKAKEKIWKRMEDQQESQFRDTRPPPPQFRR